MYELLPIIPPRKTAAFDPHLDARATAAVPNGATETLTYEPHRDLLTRVENTFNNAVISQYDYTNDPIGRRTQMSKSGTVMVQDDTLSYGYNSRSEVIAVHAQNDSAYQYDYTFDDIGNRQTATEGSTNTTYTANALNQYTAINTFTPQFDADGNQTLIQTSTGTWQVQYNGENRPILWTQGDTRIEMAYDRLGRRVSYKSTTGDTVTRHNLFLYNGYLCIQELGATAPQTIHREFIWDPTEPIATRPLQFRIPGKETTLYYMFDGNKNVSDLIYDLPANGIAAHYEYAPFGTITHTAHTSSGVIFTLDNPYRFSSEYHDDHLALTYYNYRNYIPKTGRWLTRDPIEELGGLNVYSFIKNSAFLFDILGLFGEGRKCVKYAKVPYKTYAYPGIRYETVCVGWSPLGHGDFSNLDECGFDYNLEDTGFSHPYNPLSTWRHFRTLDDSMKDAAKAAELCNSYWFQRYMHQVQDYESHRSKGYTVYTAGHMFAGTAPDNDDDAWQRSEDRTKELLKMWKRNCCILCPKEKCIWAARPNPNCSDNDNTMPYPFQDLLPPDKTPH